ncbi:MAG: hypothetical protein JW889_10440 [Verrucomicrobia bacterium]|nr:hypothetical protein [Verrucomicrobiota bacterium]
MARMMTAWIAVAALVGVAVVAPNAQARPLYHETTTITLDDGTIVNLILDDKGMPDPPPRDQMPKRVNWPQQKILEFQAKREPFDNVKKDGTVVSRAPVARLMRDPKGMDAIRNHAQQKFVWAAVLQIPQKHYYYLPPPPRVALDEKGRPQFLFVKFTTEKSEEEGGVSGGILHFLCTYGLNAAQEKELGEKLAEKIKGAKLMGALPMELGSEDSSFRVISATLTDEGFTRSLISSGKAPIMPGMKVATAARLDARGAVLLEETLKKPTSDISVEFDLAYTAFLPAFDGTITVEWSKTISNFEQYSLEYEHWQTEKSRGGLFGKLADGLFGKAKEDHYKYDEVQSIYDFMCEQELVNIEWTEEIVDERVNLIREAFMKIFTDMFFNRQAQEMDFAEEDEDKDKEEVDWKEKAKGRTFNVNTYSMKSSENFRDVKYHLRTNLPVKVPYTAVGNISGDWYRRLKAENPDCFAEVNLDDPFFQHRHIIFGLDLDAIDMFGDIVNNVTVEVRKKRTSGRDFTDSLTFDKAYIGTKGVSGTITYAKMREDDPGAFEWKAKWSMRGGREFPVNAQWQKGDWEGITLTPPVAPMLVEVGTDLEDMKALGFVGVVIQLRYRQYGKTYTDEGTLRLYVDKGESMAEKRIFVDRDALKYDYQITWYHKTEGRIQQPWVREASDGYIYCVMPDDLRTRIKKKIEEALEEKIEEVIE